MSHHAMNRAAAKPCEEIRILFAIVRIDVFLWYQQ